MSILFSDPNCLDGPKEGERDGLKTLVQHYDNHGSLGSVAAQSGVSLGRLIDWMKGHELSKENRKKLIDSMAHNKKS